MLLCCWAEAERARSRRRPFRWQMGRALYGAHFEGILSSHPWRSNTVGDPPLVATSSGRTFQGVVPTQRKIQQKLKGSMILHGSRLPQPDHGRLPQLLGPWFVPPGMPPTSLNFRSCRRSDQAFQARRSDDRRYWAPDRSRHCNRRVMSGLLNTSVGKRSRFSAAMDGQLGQRAERSASYLDALGLLLRSTVSHDQRSAKIIFQWWWNQTELL